MSRCIICFEDETPEKPLVYPCSHCAMQSHNECILNIMSTSLISQRVDFINVTGLNSELNVYDRSILFLDRGRRVYSPLTQLGELLVKDHYYRRLFTRSGICHTPPTFSSQRLDEITLLYINKGLRSKKSEVYITDECPHCKRVIKYSANTNELTMFDKILTPDKITTFERFFNKARLWIGKLKLETRLLIPSKLLASFMNSVLKYVSIIPWLVLGRNIPEYWELSRRSNPFALFTISNSLMMVGSEKTSYLSPNAYISLIINFLTSTRSLPLFFASSIVLVRMVSDFVFTITFGFKYTELMINDRPLDCERIMTTRPDLIGIPFKDWTFKDKFILAQMFLFNLSFKPTDYIDSNDPFDPHGLIVDFNNTEYPYEYVDVIDEKNGSSLPLKAFAMITFGRLIGDKLISKCKPFVSFTYRIFKRFNPKPVEIEMIFEYLGYQSVLLLNQVYQFISFYYEIKSIRSFTSVPFKIKAAYMV